MSYLAHVDEVHLLFHRSAVVETKWHWHALEEWRAWSSGYKVVNICSNGLASSGVGLIAEGNLRSKIHHKVKRMPQRKPRYCNLSFNLCLTLNLTSKCIANE